MSQLSPDFECLFAREDQRLAAWHERLRRFGGAIAVRPLTGLDFSRFPPGHSTARSCRHSIEPFLPLPGAHAVGHTFVEVGRADGGLYAAEAHPLPYFVAHSGEGEGYTLALQLLDEVQQRAAGAGVDEVYRISVQKHMLRQRAVR